MKRNVKKCKLMHVGRNEANFKYTMKGNTLQETSLEKDLGVVIHTHTTILLLLWNLSGPPE